LSIMSLVANSVTRFQCARLISELPSKEHEMLSGQLYSMHSQVLRGQ